MSDVLLGTAYVDFKSRDSGLDATMGRIQKTMMGVQDRFQAVGAMAGWALAGGAAALGGMVYAAADAEDAEARLQAVLTATGNAAGWTADELKAYASELQGVTKFEDDATVGAMAVLASFKNIGGENFKAATVAAMDMSTVMGQDLKTSMVMVGKALNDPVNGLAGLTRNGVQFTAQQKNQISTMMAVGDVAGAQAVILRELNGEFGGSAVASGAKFGGQMVILKNQIGDVAEEIGASFGPAILRAVAAMRAAIPGVVEWIKQHRELVVTSTAAAAAILGGLYVLPKVHAGVQLASSSMGLMSAAATGAGKAATLAFAHPLATVTVGAVALFAATVARSIIMNESWTDSCYAMARASGFLSFKILDLQEAREQAGKVQGKIQDASAEMTAAKTVEERRVANEKLVELLHERIALLSRVKTLEREAGYDTGAEAGIASAQQKLREAKAALNEIRAQEQAAKLNPPAPPPPPLFTPENLAEAKKQMQELADTEGNYIGGAGWNDEALTAEESARLAAADQLAAMQAELQRVMQAKAAAEQQKTSTEQAASAVQAQSGRFTGLQDVFRQIQEAAASRSNEAEMKTLAARTAESNEAIAGLAEQEKTLLERIAAATEKDKVAVAG